MIIAEVVKKIIPVAENTHDSCSDWITCMEAAKIIGYNPSYINTLVSRNILRCKKIENRKLYVSRSEVVSYMKSKTICMGNADDWITVSQASKLTGYVDSYFRYLAKKGHIKCFKKERGINYVSRKEVIEYAKKRKRIDTLQYMDKIEKNEIE